MRHSSKTKPARAVRFNQRLTRQVALALLH
jgi:hypothetical protein